MTTYGVPLDGLGRVLLTRYGRVVAIEPNHVVLAWETGFSSRPSLVKAFDADRVLLFDDTKAAWTAGDRVWRAHLDYSFEMDEAYKHLKDKLGKIKGDASPATLIKRGAG